MRFGFAVVLILAAVSPLCVNAEILTTEDASGQTTEVRGMASDQPDCQAFKFGGTIVERQFEQDTSTVESFVVEAADGRRDVFNVRFAEDVSPSLKGRVDQGLQRLTEEGRTVAGNAAACGASGALYLLDSIS